MRLSEAINQFWLLATGIALDYHPDLERTRTAVEYINQALTEISVEHDWQYYTSVETVGTVKPGERKVSIRHDARVRMMRDNAVVLRTPDGTPVKWAYLVPADSIHKYWHRQEFRAAYANHELVFSRPFKAGERGLLIEAPLIREPRLFVIPPYGGESPFRAGIQPEELRRSIDFAQPLMVLRKAVLLYAASDPMIQTRVPHLETEYKTMFFQLKERDEAFTDAPLLNDFLVPMTSRHDRGVGGWHGHPHGREAF